MSEFLQGFRVSWPTVEVIPGLTHLLLKVLPPVSSRKEDLTFLMLLMRVID